MNRLCKIGDVIRSNRFHVWEPEEDGYYDLCEIDEDGRLNTCGNEFLVIATDESGGGSGHGAGDEYPNGHCVYIKMFHGFDSKNGNANLDKTGLRFYQTGAFRGMIDKTEIELIRSLKKTVKETWHE